MFEALGNWVAFSLFGLTEQSQLGSAVQFFVMDVSKIFALLIIVIYLMAWLRAYVSSERIREIVQGKPKWVGRSLAILLGSATPFCSCSSVPLFIGFVEARIPLGITFAFLIASPMINEVALVLLMSILGWEFALWYLLVGWAVAYFGSILIEWFKPERWVESYVWDIKARQQAEQQAQQSLSLRARHDFARSEVEVIVRRIGWWVLAGVAIGAAFHGFVPSTWVESYLADGSWWSVPAAVLLGVPLYSNATGVIPVIEAMLNKGVPVGTSLAFMMSIAALSLPEILILRKVVQWPALAVFASVLSLAFILVGWLFNYLY
ncbi:permease [Thiomicrorhabdus heinhorstiae]|uniref:Permease n=1 Tax=Thiomicrorhabdus heinhorstiae TaxID=2748010 RepID=A0ABS0BUZ3_9GAMM|nr:permease [Thiomicrorhabdus heinhorstiae]MBF6057652.1 permease [Thiomicrorhabdus heinhorstiae]